MDDSSAPRSIGPVSPPIAVAGLDALPEGRISAGVSSTAGTARAAGISSTDLQTLDEPVMDTIMRDLKRITTKLRYVLIPTADQSEATRELRDWDLWGPLLLCLIISSILSWNAAAGQASLVFASMFVLVWLGSAVVTINAKLLGAPLSFFQSVCVLGYCICPLVVAALFCFFIQASWFRTVCVMGAFLWSTRASVVFMRELVAEGRRALALYPVCLFYIVISWMVFIQ